MEKKEEKKVCCICGKEYEGYGYNAAANRATTVWSFRNGGNGTRLISAVRRPVPGRCTSAELSRIMTWMSARKPSAVPRRN